MRYLLADQREYGAGHSLEAEYDENDIFPPSDITEDWLHLIDHDAENVVKVTPFRPGSEGSTRVGTPVV